MQRNSAPILGETIAEDQCRSGQESIYKIIGFLYWEGFMSITASEIMTRNVITVKRSDGVQGVAKILTDHDISAVPVCDADGAVVGMLSESDLMRPFGNERMLKRSWWLNMLAEGQDLAPEFLEYIRLDRRAAVDLMTKPVITASEDASVAELADLMTKKNIKRIPILKNGKLVGIVSRADIVRSLAYAPSEIAPSA